MNSSNSGAATFLVGSMNSANLQIQDSKDGKLLNLAYSTFGNFGRGGREASLKLVDDFKKKLSIKLGEQITTSSLK